MADEPINLEFPSGRPAPDAPGQAAVVDLPAILEAWNEATDRLQRTHQTLQAEVRRLSDELEAKNRELARRNRLADLGQMAAHVAHEIRNSLVPMKLYLSLLARRLHGDTGSESVLDKIMAGFSALEATVGDLLHFSNERDPRREMLDVAGLLQDVLQSLAPQLAAQEVRARLDCPPHCIASVDGEMLRRAVLNLVLNALDVLPAGGEIQLTASRTPRGLEIEVADSGPGIAEPLLDRLFEPFFTTKSGGTGLGLAIVERTAAAHGGQALAANRPAGGATFTLIIPQSPSSQEKAA